MLTESEPVEIVEYDPSWPASFERLRDGALRALGATAVAVEHVGSTAVPGLAAKPVIDMAVVVRSPAAVGEAIRRLEAIGYMHEGDKGVPGREAFRWPAGEPRHHLYVVVTGGAPLANFVRFRDHLRAHPADAGVYAALKRRLAAEYGSDREGYTNAKGAFVEDVLSRA